MPVGMSAGVLAVIGIFAVLIIGLLGLTAVGVMFLRKGLQIKDGSGDNIRIGGSEPGIGMPVPTKILGWGIVFIAIGVGLLIGIYGFAEITIWGILGMGLLFGGIGLIVFYLVARRNGKTNGATEATQSAE